MRCALFQPGLISFVGTTATDLEVGMKSWGGGGGRQCFMGGRQAFTYENIAIWMGHSQIRC